jgi:hypothetical protein
MKSRIKCNNETVAVLLLTGSLLLVPMNNYAYEGARNDATTALQTQNTVSDKHSAVDEATPETLLTYAKMLEAQITSAYAISSVPMLASGRNNTVKSSEDQDNVVLYGNNNAIEFSRSSTVFGNGIKANNTPNSVMMGNGIEIQGIAANGTAYDPVTGQVGPDPDRGIGNVAVGQNILVGKQLTSATAVASAGTVALGADVHLIGNYSIGIGQQSEVIGQGSIGIGHNSQIGSDNQTGYSSLTDSTAIGTGSVIQEGDATHGLGTQGGYSTAIGANTHIQGARNEALGVKSTVIGNDSTAIGYQSGIYYGQESMAVGNYATISNKEADATTSGAMAAGVRASVGEDADYSAAVGYKATVGNNAKESVAMGYNTNITKSASNATALGSFAGVSATYGTAVGYNAHAAKQGTALGGSSTAAANSTALGISSAAAAENSVALGAWSKAEITDLLSKYMPKFAWDATNDINGVVSIGQTGMTRRLINVSNGRIAADSTDAVNGSQLYHVWKD